MTALPLGHDKPREECGIVGASGLDDAVELTYLGLYALQHRGQESAGICSVDDAGVARIHRGLGLVAEVFSAEKLRTLRGRTAIGHVRYSTAGNSDLTNAQPILVRYSRGDLAIAHNGNITNAQDLRTRLVAEGAIFQTTSDTEVIIHLIARSRHETVEAQLDDALTHLDGAFSLVLVVGETLFAVRDPWGYRPLVIGRKDGGRVVASETCALDIIGAEYVRDVAPGEVLKIEAGTITPLRRLPPAPRPAPCIFELVYFARPDSRVWGCSVDRARRAFGRQLAREHPVDADAVLSVPDSSNSAALGYSEESRIPYELGLIRNHYIGRTFIQPVQTDRDFGARIKYNAVREAIEGRRIVVVDDSLIRGTTSRSLVRFIRSAGAREVHFRISSPPVRFPCYYGIDFPTREELIGARLTVDEIRRHLGVDSLGYLSLDGMKTAVAEFGPFCDACFSGDYTAPLTDLERGYTVVRPDRRVEQPAGAEASRPLAAATPPGLRR
ncbi:MAG: amidophosphoribosyltransferase [Gemmatimonadetes bacterium]|nr:amidophosphoribosyltransferase [Gemmatimonadota bacterium]